MAWCVGIVQSAREVAKVSAVFPMPDQLLRALVHPHRLRIVAIISTDAARSAAVRHQASPAAACAVGRGLTGGLLLACLSASSERVTLQIFGSGPLRGVHVDTYDDGLVRAYPMAPQAGSDSGRVMARRQRLCDFLGRQGVVHVVRDIGVRDRYQSQVNFVTGEIDEDLESFLRDSEQVPSALGCEVILDEDGQVLAAGGVLMQRMPDSPESAEAVLREAQHALRSGELYDLLTSGTATPESLVRLVAGSGPHELELLDTRPVEFRCRCDLRRIEAMVSGLPLPDLDAMITEGKAEISCNFCAEVYTLSVEKLLAIRAEHPDLGKDPN